MLFAYATAVQHIAVSDAMAARVDAQAWRVDRLTKQFQVISDLADGARAAAKAGGDMAGHIMNHYLKGKSGSFTCYVKQPTSTRQVLSLTD